MNILKEIIFYISALIIFTCLMYVGFYIGYLTNSKFQTPGYEKYGLPLRTNFLWGCEIYVDNSWENCQVYSSFNKND